MSGVFETIKQQLSKETNKTVYRFISERERVAIQQGDLDGIGSNWQSNNHRSTHKYREGSRYVHFLDNVNDAMDIYNELKASKSYLCTYSIPTKILKKYSGKGFYPPHGYDLNYTEIKEYAIPSEEFDFSWIISIEKASEFLRKIDDKQM